jgi:predicted patatin/cPLA2 family phospholipase
MREGFMSSLGLVLEGGGMRGAYTAGVLDCFMQNKIEVDGVVGVSAGATHACNFISKQYKRNYRIDVIHARNPKFMSFRSFFKTGDFFGKDFCYDALPNEIDPFDYETFAQSKIPFYVVCTDLETGEAKYIPMTDLKKQMDYLRASASLPLLSKIVEIDGKKYLDGGVSDSIPIHFMEKQGFDHNIVVLTRPSTYRKKPVSFFSLIQKKYKDYPRFIHASAERHLVYNETLDYVQKQAQEKKAFVFRPSKNISISRLERSGAKLEKLYELGFQDALRQKDALDRFIEKSRI